MINGVTFKVNVDDYILNTLKEDITSEDVSTNAVMPEDYLGTTVMTVLSHLCNHDTRLTSLFFRKLLCQFTSTLEVAIVFTF